MTCLPTRTLMLLELLLVSINELSLGSTWWCLCWVLATDLSKVFLSWWWFVCLKWPPLRSGLWMPSSIWPFECFLWFCCHPDPKKQREAHDVDVYTDHQTHLPPVHFLPFRLLGVWSIRAKKSEKLSSAQKRKHLSKKVLPWETCFCSLKKELRKKVNFLSENKKTSFSQNENSMQVIYISTTTISLDRSFWLTSKWLLSPSVQINDPYLVFFFFFFLQNVIKVECSIRCRTCYMSWPRSRMRRT